MNVYKIIEQDDGFDIYYSNDNVVWEYIISLSIKSNAELIIDIFKSDDILKKYDLIQFI